MNPLKTILLYCFAIFSVCFPITINVDQPYSAGTITFKRYHLDTVTFSNGLMIYPCNFNIGNAENTDMYVSFAMENYNKAGFRKLPSSGRAKIISSRQNEYDGYENLEAYSSSDTEFTNAASFPDSLLTLDSIAENAAPGEPATMKIGKWFMNTNTSIAPFPNTLEHPIGGFKVVVYISTMKNKVKLQISNLYMNNYEDESFPVGSTILDSMEIKWAVDSFSNGKFNDIVHVKRNGLTEQFPGPFSYADNILKVAGKNVELYSINGRLLPGLLKNNCRLQKGAVIYKMNSRNSSTHFTVMKRIQVQ